MLQAIVTFLPVLLLMIGAMLCLVVNFETIAGRLVVIAIPLLAILFTVFQFYTQTGPPGDNLLATPQNAFMIIVTLSVIIVIIATARDFTDEHTKRFFHVLIFLMATSITGFLYSNNMFLIGMFGILSGIVISTLRFIFPATNNRVYNELLVAYCTGTILYFIGAIMIQEVSPSDGSFLAELPLVTIPDLARYTLFAGLLIMAATFPVSLLVDWNLHVKSHDGVKMFNILLGVVMYWKYMQFADAAGFYNVITTWVNGILGLGNIVAGIAIVSREMLRNKDRRIDVVVLGAILIDFGTIQMLYSAAGELANSTTLVNFLADAIMLQLLITLSTKIPLLLAVKNIKTIFKTDAINEMGGLKLRAPATLVGFIAGTTGSVYLGIFVLNEIYTVTPWGVLSFTAILFVAEFVLLIFAPTWTALAIAKIFGGKDLPISMKNAPWPRLAIERMGLAIMVALQVVFILALVFTPSNSFLQAITPTVG